MLECWTKEMFHGENLQSNLLSSNERRLWADEKEPGRGYTIDHIILRTYVYVHNYTYTCNSHELFSAHVRKLVREYERGLTRIY